MRKATHEEMISGEMNGSKFTAFITGVPDQCKHDDDGEILHFNDNGEYFKQSEIPSDDTSKNKWFMTNKICGSCVSCSKCGKPYSPDLWAI